MQLILAPYQEILTHTDCVEPTFMLGDHLNGFDKHGNNSVLSTLDLYGKENNKFYKVIYHQILPDYIKQLYSNLEICYSIKHQEDTNFVFLKAQRVHSKLDFKNFVCSFNGSNHVSRLLLTAIMHRYKLFNPEYSTKNFSCSTDDILNHVYALTGNQDRIYNKFFIDETSTTFLSSIYSVDYRNEDRYKHYQHIKTLDPLLTKSFVHIVSESQATSYTPFITEKFLYSVVTRGLFLSYAQPGWHEWLEKYYGFKKYTRLFDYRFDSINDPIERLVELISSLLKYSVLSNSDWNDLYQLEIDTIEYNYEHYFSGNYLKTLENSCII